MGPWLPGRICRQGKRFCLKKEPGLLLLKLNYFQGVGLLACRAYGREAGALLG